MSVIEDPKLGWPTNLDAMDYKDDPTLSLEDNLEKRKFHLSMLKFWIGLQYPKICFMDQAKAKETFNRLNQYTKEVEEKLNKL